MKPVKTGPHSPIHPPRGAVMTDENSIREFSEFMRLRENAIQLEGTLRGKRRGLGSIALLGAVSTVFGFAGGVASQLPQIRSRLVAEIPALKEPPNAQAEPAVVKERLPTVSVSTVDGKPWEKTSVVESENHKAEIASLTTALEAAIARIDEQGRLLNEVDANNRKELERGGKNLGIADRNVRTALDVADKNVRAALTTQGAAIHENARNLLATKHAILHLSTRIDGLNIRIDGLAAAISRR